MTNYEHLSTNSPNTTGEAFSNLHNFLTEHLGALAVGTVTLAAGVGAASYLASTMGSKTPVEPVVDINNQSVIIDGKPEHRASWLSHAPQYYTFDRTHPECNTVYDILEYGKKLSNNGPCFGSRTGPNREYEFMSYQTVIDKVHQFGSGLVHLGYPRRNDTLIGIYATNIPEWSIADFGSQAFSMCPVPLYDTLGLEAIKYILNQCKMQVVVTDTVEKLQKLLGLKAEVPFMKLVIVVEPVIAEMKEAAKKQNVELLQFDELLALGTKHMHNPLPPKPSDLFSIIYTSGTTGNPKGAMLTHRSFILMIDSVLTHIRKHAPFTPNDVHLSYLPLAHAFDRSVCLLILISGGRIGYYSRDPTLIMDDLAALRPTVFPSVPRLYNKIYDAVMADVQQSKIKSTLLKWALESKSKEVNRMIIRRDSFWDKLIFKKIQNKLGGRVRVLITGSAPLSHEVMMFLKCAFGCIVLEGYGQTEAGAGVTFSTVGDTTVGSVGTPLPGIHVKLADVPEMEYYAKNNIGEVCAKGDTLLSGYYKLPDKTRETLDEEGWLHTGDVGMWLPNGTLKIVDRVKHIFKLSQGEYIAPEKIENIYRSSPYIAQCFVEGSSLKSALMAVVVPDADYLAKWAPKHGYPSDVHEFCKSKEAYKLVMDDMKIQAKKAGLVGFEQVVDIYLEPAMFSVERELLTPTLKNKRPALRMMYKEEINKLYEKNQL